MEKRAMFRAARAAAALAAVAALGGCRGVLDPAGPVGEGNRLILLNSLVIMLAIVVPTIVITLWVAFWFRASNTRALHRPDWEYSGRLELLVWSIPTLAVIFLGGVAWVGSHELEPSKPLNSKEKPLVVQVVSLDWKWLFIYPEQNVASVNHLVVPVGTPLDLRLTSGSVMNSFFVPQLGSQLYAMAGMATRLHLQADRTGVFAGLSAQYSGAGFSGMRFEVEARPRDGFDSWVAETRGAGGKTLDAAAYDELAQPSRANDRQTWSAVEPELFTTIMEKAAPGSGRHMAILQQSKAGDGALETRFARADWPAELGEMKVCVSSREVK